MRKILSCTLMIGLICASYIAWPFWSALQLRQAVVSGDVAAIERKVDWQSLRATLKASLSRYAGLLHNADFGDAAATPAAGPGLWQRSKSFVGRSAVDAMVNRMVTPKGLPRLFAARETYRHDLRPALGFARPKRAFDGTWLEGGRIAKFVDSMERIERVVFTSLTTVEIEIIDRYRPERHYVSVLQLKDFDWKLVGLRLVIPGV